MKTFNAYLEEAYDIAITSNSDVDKFDTKMDKKGLKAILKKSERLVGDEKGRIKVPRGSMSEPELDAFRKKFNFTKGNVKFGSGSAGKGGGNLSGADWEQVIVAAYNMKANGVDLQTAIKQGGMQDSWFDKFNEHVPIGDKIVENAFRSTKAKMEHYGSDYGELSKEWEQYFLDLTGKRAFSSTKTPKTDMYISRERISLKKAGGSQLMSGGKAETAATLAFAYKNLDKKVKTRAMDKAFNALYSDIESKFTAYKLPAGETITTLRRKMKTGKGDDLTNKIFKTDDLHKDMSRALNDLVKTPEIKEAMVYEAMTGQNKFKDKLASASHILVFDDSGNASYKKIDQKIVSKYAKVTKLSITFKTGGRTASSTLRGVVNEAFEETDREMLQEGIFTDIKNFLKRWFMRILNKIKKLFISGLEKIKELGLKVSVNNPKVVYSV